MKRKCFTCIDTDTSVVISILFRNVHHSQVEPPLKTSLREKFDFEMELRQSIFLLLSVWSLWDKIRELRGTLIDIWSLWLLELLIKSSTYPIQPTFLMDDILDVLIVAVEGTGVVGDYPAPQHPFSLWDGVTCHHKVIKSDYYYSL